MTAATVSPESSRDLWTGAPAGEDTTSSLTAPRRHSAQRWIMDRGRVVRIVSDRRDERILGTNWERFLFQVAGKFSAFDLRVFAAPLSEEVSQIGYPGDTVTSSAPSPSLSRRAEPDASVWRGVFAIRHQTTLLFTQDVMLDLRSLPKSRPHITISRRMREADDE